MDWGGTCNQGTGSGLGLTRGPARHRFRHWRFFSGSRGARVNSITSAYTYFYALRRASLWRSCVFSAVVGLAFFGTTWRATTWDGGVVNTVSVLAHVRDTWMQRRTPKRPSVAILANGYCRHGHLVGLNEDAMLEGDEIPERAGCARSHMLEDIRLGVTHGTTDPLRNLRNPPQTRSTRTPQRRNDDHHTTTAVATLTMVTDDIMIATTNVATDEPQRLELTTEKGRKTTTTAPGTRRDDETTTQRPSTHAMRQILGSRNAATRITTRRRRNTAHAHLCNLRAMTLLCAQRHEPQACTRQTTTTTRLDTIVHCEAAMTIPYLQLGRAVARSGALAPTEVTSATRVPRAASTPRTQAPGHWAMSWSTHTPHPRRGPHYAIAPAARLGAGRFRGRRPLDAGDLPFCGAHLPWGWRRGLAP